MRCARTLVAFVLACAASACTKEAPATEPLAIDLRAEIDKPGRAIYAVEYARSRGVALGKLIAGADSTATTEMSWYFYVLVGDGTVALVDTGSDVLADPESAERKQWKVFSARTVKATLARVGLVPADVKEVMLTHAHWDHADGLVHFTHARMYAHETEWARILASERRRGRAAKTVASAGRAALFNVTPKAVLPGIEARVAGRHTEAHSMYVVTCRGGRRVAIGGDGAYLYRNLEESLPIAVSTSPEDNVRDMSALATELGAHAVLPGHDPLLFKRFKTVASGEGTAIARICP